MINDTQLHLTGKSSMKRVSNKRPYDEKKEQFGIEWDTTETLQRDSDSNSKRIRHNMVQPLSEQGWQRCQVGFDGVSLEEEEEEETRRIHQTKAGGAKRMSLSSTTPATLEGSSLDIDWSSSSDSLSDVEPLLLQELSHASNSKKIMYKHRRTQQLRGKHRLHRGTKLQSGRCKKSTDEEEDFDITEEEGGDEKRGSRGGWSSKPPSVTEQGQSTSSLEEKKSSQIHISDYDSPSEDQLNMASSPQEESSSLHISDLSPTPLPTPVESPSKESPRTGTELLKRLKLPERTPDKEGNTGGPSGGGDSAKKKKKFIRDGLAEGLQRVMNREKSSMVFWSHRTADIATPQSMALDLIVLSVEEVRGLFVTRCQMQPLTSEVNAEMFVLFSQANGRQLKLGVESRVRVYPPWQKLTLPTYKEPVILCTYFCHSVDSTDGDLPAVNQSLSLQHMIDGSSVGQQMKPLQLFKQSKPISAPKTEPSTLQSITPRSMEAQNCNVSDSFLDSIAQTGGTYSATGMCVRATVHRVYHRRWHAEATVPSRKHPNNTTVGSAVQASQWTLLIQDNQGVFCELQVTEGGTGEEEEEEEWRRCLRQGEGKTMIFSGLKVMRRVNRTRSPGLFSLIDSMWSPCEGTASQSEMESQDSAPHGLRSPQSFCYILGVQTLKNTIRKEVTNRATTPYRQPVIHTLGEIKKMLDICNQRVACYAKLVHAHPVTNPHTATQQPLSQSSTSDWHLFLTDHSLTPETDNKSGNATGTIHKDSGDKVDGSSEGQGAGLAVVYVRRSCSVVECAEDCLEAPGSLVLLRDLCCGQGGDLYADTFTTIQRLSEDDTEKEIVRTSIPEDDTIITRLSSIRIPPLPGLGLQSDQQTLVSISGVVTGVDEGTAYSWPACDSCGNDRLETDPSSGSQLHCKTCQKSVTSPLARMHLEIILDCPSLDPKEAKVKVQILQSSIERVLPPLSSQDDGYDMQCIMGINIGPMSCFLKTVARQPGEPVTFELEEVSLEPRM